MSDRKCWKCHQPITAERPDDGSVYASNPPKYAHLDCTAFSPEGEPLKPCPFCGSLVQLIGYHADSPQRHYIECCNCLTKIWGRDSREQIICDWNNRPDARPQPDAEKIAEAHVTAFLDGRMGTTVPTKFQLTQLVLWGMNWRARETALAPQPDADEAMVRELTLRRRIIDRIDGELERALAEVTALSAQLASVNERLKWDPVGERLPEQFGWYEVTIQETTSLQISWFVDIVSYGHSVEMGNYWNVREGRVIAWRPRSNPYVPDP